MMNSRGKNKNWTKSQITQNQDHVQKHSRKHRHSFKLGLHQPVSEILLVISIFHLQSYILLNHRPILYQDPVVL